MQIKILAITFLLFLFALLKPTHIHAQEKSLPYSPNGPYFWCLPGEAAVKLKWFNVDGATSYQVRVDADNPSWDGSCTSGDSCLSTTTNEITVPIIPNKPYDWWVHSVNANGWSTPAMDGVQFTCQLPPPNGLHYQCMPDNTVVLSWIPNNPANLYGLSFDAAAPSWNDSCASPDKCLSVNTNSIRLPIDRNVQYSFWLQSKDIKGNKSINSQTMSFKCNEGAELSPTLTDSPTLTPTITSMPTSTITITAVPSPSQTLAPSPSILPSPSVLPSPSQIATAEPTVSGGPDCPKKSNGDANCDGAINLEDYECWKGVFINNFLETSRGCRYTNFDETNGTNILDFAIWHVHRES